MQPRRSDRLLGPARRRRPLQLSPPDARSVPDLSEGDDFAGRTAFLDALGRHGIVTEACLAADISEAVARSRRERFPTFATDWDTMVKSAIGRLEAAAWSLAVGTTVAPAVRLTYDPGLLKFLLKANKPETYGARVRTDATERRAAIEEDPDPPRLDRGRDG